MKNGRSFMERQNKKKLKSIEIFSINISQVTTLRQNLRRWKPSKQIVQRRRACFIRIWTTNYNRFVTEDNREDPVELWTHHYEAKTSGNHAKVYNYFITLQFKDSNLASYLDTVDEHMKIMSSVGMKFQGRLQLSVKTEDSAMAATKSKSKRPEYCSGGKHNPKASHPEKDFWQLTKTGLSYLDSGASHHMFADKRLFINYRPRSTKVEIANGNTLAVEGDGFVHVVTEVGTVIKLKATAQLSMGTWYSSKRR
ncbi:uncharacterized protein VP01_1638g1 [Puccinia sorghi]|uniref:Retrovirus-related Pol polyprotein from transposon TNT 1-94-like beta-barrel domain-containing protein n=1 Tax=Puccinia sorghi TaxID=27349 RepID=A0A0L6VIL9_9BASI|nr:uncharacterized protein VP01_1638g1 [Puccinia sorghi]